MAYSVVSQAELRKMGNSHPALKSKAKAKGYSVTAKGDTYGTQKAREKQANKARAKMMKGGGRGGKQRRVPAGSPRGGEFTR